MVIVGKRIAPTARVYPILTETCETAGHQSQDNRTLLRASGHSGPKQNGQYTPVYTWTCSGCGARWNRLPAPPDHPMHDPENYARQTALTTNRPPPRRSGPLLPQGVVPSARVPTTQPAPPGQEDPLLPGPMTLG